MRVTITPGLLIFLVV